MSTERYDITIRHVCGHEMPWTLICSRTELAAQTDNLTQKKCSACRRFDALARLAWKEELDEVTA